MSDAVAWIAAAIALAVAAAALVALRRSHAAAHAQRRELERVGERLAKAEAALASSLQVADALPDGIVILAGDRIEWCNEAARRHLAIELPRDEGLPITHLVRDPAFLDSLHGGAAHSPVEVRLAASPGRVLELQWAALGTQRVLLARDVSHTRRLEQVGREFVANVSHELRTPLTVIAGFIETLRDEGDAGAGRRYLDLMAAQSNRMQRLVEDLLTLSSLESAPPPPDDPIDMSALVARLEAEAQALSRGRHRIEVHCEAGLHLAGSERELSSALGNLVANAIRYTPEGGRVGLAWHAAGDGADFDVEDNGVGIASEHIPRLTERFYRVDRGRSRESGGTGLGLAIVKQALERHGAALHIGSTPGKGSRFSAHFPRARVRRTRA